MHEGEHERLEAAVDTWAQGVLSHHEFTDQVRAALPLLERLRPRWEQLWRQNVDCPSDASLGRDELMLLGRWAFGEKVNAEDLLGAAARAKKLALNVGAEDGLHEEDDLGYAQLFTALLATSLLEAAGQPDDEHRFAELVSTTRTLVSAYPSLGEAFGKQ